MSQDIKELIEKINREGVQAAEDNARKIEQAAKEEAVLILEKAKKETEKLIAEARENIRMMEEKQQSLLAQAGRDLLLSLRASINTMLNKIVVERIREALTPQELAALIAKLAKHVCAGHIDEIEVTLKKEDYQALEHHFLSALKEEIKKGITLKPSPDVLGGFYISFDAGRSQFDFSDSALAEYIGTYLKPKLAEILNPGPKKR